MNKMKMEENEKKKEKKKEDDYTVLIFSIYLSFY